MQNSSPEIIGNKSKAYPIKPTTIAVPESVKATGKPANKKTASKKNSKKAKNS